MSKPELKKAAECLRTIAHPERLKMVQLLGEGRYTVGELAEICKMQSHMASEHLRLMERCGLLGKEREGRKIYYEISEPELCSLMTIIGTRFGGKKGKGR